MAEVSGILRVVSPDELAAKEQQELETKQLADRDQQDEEFSSQLAAYIHKKFEAARRHRTSEGIEQRLLDSLRVYKGEYTPEKLREIQKFQGSTVYSRLVAAKCRGAAALLRDIYLTAERPWELAPTPEPTVPSEVMENIDQLVQVETSTLSMAGQPVDPTAVMERVKTLQQAARRAEKKRAAEEARAAGEQLDDILWEGGFYDALTEFLTDLPIFPYACIKGPVVRMVSQIKWQPDGTMQQEDTPKLFWYRVSPFDVWFTPSASNIRQSDLMERMRLSYAELHSLIGVPGYNEDAIRRVLERAQHGAPSFTTWASHFEAERAFLETRQNPAYSSDDDLIDTLEFTGYVRGQLLLDWGYDSVSVPDPLGAHFVTAWLIDRDIIKVQMVPLPRQRPPLYLTSFERVPGSMIGHGLPDILTDINDVSNATLRALVNNLSIASGPQVVINEDLLSPTTDGAGLYPWKRWFTISDPLQNSSLKPVDFFQPNSNSNELLTVYEKFNQMADEISAIPRYMTGSDRMGGAGRTASGLAMLMNNSSKVMQSVAASIDNEIIKPCLEQLYDMVMLTDESGVLRGDENIVVKGVSNAVQREEDRVRQLEFLQLTGNPIDVELIGMKGRAAVLRSVSRNLGLDYEHIVPSDEEIDAMMQQQQEQAAQEQGMGPGDGSNQLPGPDEAQSEGGPPHLNTQANARQSGI